MFSQVQSTSTPPALLSEAYGESQLADRKKIVRYSSSRDMDIQTRNLTFQQHQKRDAQRKYLPQYRQASQAARSTMSSLELRSAALINVVVHPCVVNMERITALDTTAGPKWAQMFAFRATQLQELDNPALSVFKTEATHGPGYYGDCATPAGSYIFEPFGADLYPGADYLHLCCCSGSLYNYKVCCSQEGAAAAGPSQQHARQGEQQGQQQGQQGQQQGQQQDQQQDQQQGQQSLSVTAVLERAAVVRAGDPVSIQLTATRPLGAADTLTLVSVPYLPQPKVTWQADGRAGQMTLETKTPGTYVVSMLLNGTTVKLTSGEATAETAASVVILHGAIASDTCTLAPTPSAVIKMGQAMAFSFVLRDSCGNVIPQPQVSAKVLMSDHEAGAPEVVVTPQQQGGGTDVTVAFSRRARLELSILATSMDGDVQREVWCGEVIIEGGYQMVPEHCCAVADDVVQWGQDGHVTVSLKDEAKQPCVDVMTAEKAGVTIIVQNKEGVALPVNMVSVRAGAIEARIDTGATTSLGAFEVVVHVRGVRVPVGDEDVGGMMHVAGDIGMLKAHLEAARRDLRDARQVAKRVKAELSSRTQAYNAKRSQLKTLDAALAQKQGGDASDVLLSAAAAQRDTIKKELACERSGVMSLHKEHAAAKLGVERCEQRIKDVEDVVRSAAAHQEASIAE
jgi:hypothetical protein